ncbi:MAG: alpha/beta hydrolase [Cyanobacteria bacterium J06554_11]
MLTVNIAGVTHAYELTEAFSAEYAATQAPADAFQQTTKPHAISPLEEAAYRPTLVFIHGWLLSQAYWRPLVHQLSETFRCLTYDLRGFGASTGSLAHSGGDRKITIPQERLSPLRHFLVRDSDRFPASEYSLAAYAQDLEALLDHLEIERVWLLGHSLGGSIALWAAYLLPHRVEGVICINAGGGIYIHTEFEKFRSAGQQMVKVRPPWLSQLPLLPRVFSRLMVKQPLATHWGRQRIEDFVRAGRQAAEGALLETTSQQEVHLLPQVVREITQPVHFITATEDTIMPPRYVRYLASFHPQFITGETVTELSDCGHMAMVEQPDTVANVIRSVLREAVPRKANQSTEIDGQSKRGAPTDIAIPPR